jgi:hypothetical protein
MRISRLHSDRYREAKEQSRRDDPDQDGKWRYCDCADCLSEIVGGTC